MNDNITHRRVTMTPEWAAELLSRNTNNRKLPAVGLAQLKAKILRGEWKYNGEAIKVAENGVLLDGQTRLHACIQTGTPLDTLLIEGLPLETQDTMDTGITRRAHHVLEIRGYKQANLLAAIVMGIIRSEQYSIRAGTLSAGSAYPVTTNQMLERLEREPSIQELVAVSWPMARIGLHGRIAGLLYYRFSEIDGEDTAHFFDRLSTGERLEAGDPILTLRNQLINLKNSRGAKSQTYVAALTIKAWNKFRAGEPVGKLNFRPGGANPEKFPEPR